MKKILIFGAGFTGEHCLKQLSADKENKVIGFLDNDSKKWGKTTADLPIFGDASYIKSFTDYDEIVIGSLPGLYVMRQQLIEAGCDPLKINSSIISGYVTARSTFLKNYAATIKASFDVAKYACAEGGVYQGEFAKEINASFPDCKLYLFDTFEGFDSRDIADLADEKKSFLTEGHLSNTSVDLVLSKLPHKEMVEIRKGYFPETTEGLKEEKYIFVNLDFDLYKPTLEGLRYFYPKMERGAIILIHDYFTAGYSEGVQQAVREFMAEHKEAILMPIGDDYSIGVIKTE